MGSEVCKTFSRLLLGRTGGSLPQHNSWQRVSPGRQPSDLIFTIMSGMALSIQKSMLRRKAYDKVNRCKLMAQLEEVLGWNDITRKFSHRGVRPVYHFEVESNRGRSNLSFSLWKGENWFGPLCVETVPEELVGKWMTAFCGRSRQMEWRRDCLHFRNRYSNGDSNSMFPTANYISPPIALIA